MPLGADVHIGHTENVEAHPLSGFLGIAEGGNGGNLHGRVDAQRVLDGLAVGEGQPAGAEAHVLQLQHQIFHHKARVLVGQLRLLGQQHQILGRADEELIVACRPLQGLAGIVTENPQLGVDAGCETLAGVLVVGFQFIADSLGHLLVGKLAGRFSVLNQGIVIHGDSSLID